MRENDGVDHFQLASGLIYAEHGERGGAQYKAKRSHIPLNQYRSASRITEKQYRAGNRLCGLYITSRHLHHPVICQYGEGIGGNLKNFERKFEISQLYMLAIMDIQGGIIRDTVFRVCCDQMPANRGKMDELRQGLDQLLSHFDKIDRHTKYS
jgi:hypothetical protein